ncbi:MAG: hypothetical protein ACTS74_03765, partial [Arsenophonus sp. ET-YP4-MAG3]
MFSPLLDDLNTVSAIQALHQLAQTTNSNPKFLPIFAASTDLLGLRPKKRTLNKQLTATIERLIEERLEFLELKNFSTADRIRDILAEKGFLLKDHKNPTNDQR